MTEGFPSSFMNLCTPISCFALFWCCCTLRIVWNYLPYLSFHGLITQPNCCHVLFHSGCGLDIKTSFTTQGKGYETKSGICICTQGHKHNSQVTLSMQNHNWGNTKSKHSIFIMLWVRVQSCLQEFLYEKYCTLFDFWGSLALGSKQSGQSKAFWYYHAEKRHL